MSIELPKDADGREIPLDTKVLYGDDGECFEVNRFTYSVVQTMPGLKWGVVFMDCRYDYCSSFYLTPPEPPDSWEKLEEDLDRAAKAEAFRACRYANDKTRPCNECRFLNKKGLRFCNGKALAEILDRIHELRGED